NVRAAKDQIPDAINKQTVERYGLEQWNAARIEGEIAEVAAWGKRWNVPLTCNEFGVYRATSNPTDRAAWLRDVRTVLEKIKIGWTMWDYAGVFAVVNRENGATSPDAVTVEALGIKPPPGAPGFVPPAPKQ